MMNPNPQILLDIFATARTGLARIARIDLHNTPPGAFSLVRCELDKLIPRGIRNGLSETVILVHPFEVQIFKDNDAVAIDQFAALLMREISPLVGYLLKRWAFHLNNVKTHPRYDEARWFYLMNFAIAGWGAGLI